MVADDEGTVVKYFSLFSSKDLLATPANICVLRFSKIANSQSENRTFATSEYFCWLVRTV